jgi:hypothetical protein
MMTKNGSGEDEQIYTVTTTSSSSNASSNRMLSLTSLPQIRKRREELRIALQQRNASLVADLLRLPPLSSTNSQGSGASATANDQKINQYKAILSSNSSSTVELVEGTGNSGSNVDWTNVFKSWLLASYAATLVSFLFFFQLFHSSKFQILYRLRNSIF